MQEQASEVNFKNLVPADARANVHMYVALYFPALEKKHETVSKLYAELEMTMRDYRMAGEKQQAEHFGDFVDDWSSYVDAVSSMMEVIIGNQRALICGRRLSLD